MTEEVQQDLKEIFKSDMKTAEKMDNLLDDHSRESISESSVDVAEGILKKVDNPEREKYVYATLYQIGQSVGNEQLAEFAAKKLEAWVDQYGPGQ